MWCISLVDARPEWVQVQQVDACILLGCLTVFNSLVPSRLRAATHQAWSLVTRSFSFRDTVARMPPTGLSSCGHLGLTFTPPSLFQFSFSTCTWRMLKSMPLVCLLLVCVACSGREVFGGSSSPPRRFGHTMVHFGGGLYVFGGSADSALPNHLYRHVHVHDHTPPCCAALMLLQVRH